MKKKKFVKLFGALLAVAISAALPLSANAETDPYERYNITKEPMQYGESGYPIVVPWPDREGYFIQPNKLPLLAVGGLDVYFGGDTGLFEFDGRVIYLSWSKQQKVAIVNYGGKNEDGTYTNYVLYCDADGRIREYTDETKPAIDAEIAAHLVQLEGNVQSLYGVSFLHRDAFSPIDKYSFAKTISDALASYPADSVRIIADTTKGATGKQLRFQSVYKDADENKDASWWVDGTYNSKGNIVQTSGGFTTTAHELGHGMEAALNTASGGRLEADFLSMNGGAAYSLYYYYDGDPELYNNVPLCFKTSYSGTSFSEDFADTFADALCYPMSELEERYAGYEQYLQKISYVKQLFNQYAGATVLQ